MGDPAAQSILAVAVALGKYPHEVAAEMSEEQIAVTATYLTLKGN
ncbi:hypothetical protein BD830_11633 [Maritimibacter alkaliphilus HTCC2654]|jgi:hypothetical protein|uniref:Uncharacterized protein n=1 Tax=Maritimibacter alkaliphilus HTCC2654 TaxID=314271 RepID=A3VBE4_9RHOB|nr:MULTISPECIES: hypothetical protein [Maritimibacter]EAQ14277.1 hypothetical protein RB2654_16446 [Rhodobacterales bacterium HTCC2654] [Maritimibacter alkaliphilus HTCC2654]TYP78526.1 hypothetical protein BD830_11633 [Maritimibacter alkaliphilus HTCC2654]